jgi:hypothetical protein
MVLCRRVGDARSAGKGRRSQGVRSIILAWLIRASGGSILIVAVRADEPVDVAQRDRVMPVPTYRVHTPNDPRDGH